MSRMVAASTSGIARGKRASPAWHVPFTVRLTANDDLAADNQASIVSLLPKPVKVLLVSRGNRLVEKALRAAAGVELTIANDLTDPAGAYDFVVLDDVNPTVWPKGNELGRQRIAWVGFDVLESNWPLRVSFPIFMANAVDWLNPANAKGSELLVKAGEAFRLLLNHPETSAKVTLPSGESKILNLDPNANELVFGDTYKQGTYHLQTGTNETVFCVDLLDANESNIKPRDDLRFTRP